MIANFRLKSGRSPGSVAERIAATPVTVFVGPNNSGKSRILSEIHQFCSSGQKLASNVLLDDIEMSRVQPAEAQRLVMSIVIPQPPGISMPEGHVGIGHYGGMTTVNYKQLLDVIRDPHTNLASYCHNFLCHYTRFLDGSSRMNLVNMQQVSDLQSIPMGTLHALFKNDAKREEVRRIVADAFGVYFVIDPTRLGHLRIRLSARPPISAMEERGIHEEAVKFHGEAQLMDSMSDGIKAFTGIIAELIAGDPRILLIDEPEAFLHPALAFKLGHEISAAAFKAGKSLFASTHSASFLMGCIQSGAPVNVVRLTFRGGIATARILPSAEIVKLMRNPLLRSTGVISGLFYEFVVVTESDADRAFYQEVNERMLRFSPNEGIPSCLFINAQNKQTVQTIIKPLRNLGIPVAGIVDIDVLKDGGSVWTGLLESAGVPRISHQSLSTLRVAVKTAMELTGKDIKREGGVSILSGKEREAALNFLGQLAEYGIFVVPDGELESWLKSLNTSGHGPQWLISMFGRMGEDPAHADYVKPGNDDVWEFISKMKTWLVSPTRKGIPD